MEKNSRGYSILNVILYVFVFLSIVWSISTKNRLVFDDYSNISVARFTEFRDLFSFLPSQYYNDRPVGLMFVKVLNILFDSNYQSYHFAFAIIHLINVYLGVQICNILYRRFELKHPETYSLLTMAIFGIYPISLMAVSWISAVYDIMAALFMLLSILFYLKSKAHDNFSNYFAIFSILFYFLSIRSKEMIILLPLIFLIIDLYFNYRYKEKIFSWYLSVMLFMMVLFVSIIVSSKTTSFDALSPYYQSFNPVDLIKNSLRYLFLYFDFQNSGFTFSGYSATSVPGVVLFLFIIAYSIYTALFRGRLLLLITIIFIGLSFAIVLPMSNMQHRLYLYIPSFFLGITFSVFVNEFSRFDDENILKGLTLIFFISLYLVNFTPGVLRLKEAWYMYGESDYKLISKMAQIERPSEGTNIYIKGVLEGYNVFFYGPGNSIKLLYDDASLRTFLVDEFPVQLETPYLLIEYQNNKLIEIDRNNSPKELELVSYFPTLLQKTSNVNPDGSLDFGIITNYINNNLVISINGKNLPTIIGDEFISASIPAFLLNSGVLEIKVVDKLTGAETNAFIIKVDN